MVARPITPLRTVLVDEGRKQSWLADRTQIDPATINRIVHGLPPSEAQAEAIASALGREIGELWPPIEAAA